ARHLLRVADVDPAVSDCRVVPGLVSRGEDFDSAQLAELRGGRFHKHHLAELFRHCNDHVVAEQDLTESDPFALPRLGLVLPDLLAVLQVHALEVSVVQTICIVPLAVFTTNTAGEFPSHHRTLRPPNLRNAPLAATLRDLHP